MTEINAAERLELASLPRGGPAGSITTHEMARCLLALPDVPLKSLDQQGGPEAWSGQLHPEVEVQVGIRSW